MNATRGAVRAIELDMWLPAVLVGSWKHAPCLGAVPSMLGSLLKMCYSPLNMALGILY